MFLEKSQHGLPSLDSKPPHVSNLPHVCRAICVAIKSVSTTASCTQRGMVVVVCVCVCGRGGGGGEGGGAVTIFYCSAVSPLGSAPTHILLGTIPLIIDHCLLTPEGSRVV